MASTYYTTNAVWSSWNDDTSTSDATVWTYWNNTTATTSNAADAWYHWTTNTVTNDYCYETDRAIWGSWNEQYTEYNTTIPITLSSEPRKRSRSDRKKPARDYIKGLKRKKKQDRKAMILAETKRRAELKAQELLFDLLGEEQFERFNRTGRLLVKGGKYDWLISKLPGSKEEHRHVNIQKVKKDKIIDLCVRIDDPVPPSDKVITYALRSKYDEKAFEKTVNTTRVNKNQVIPECANF